MRRPRRPVLALASVLLAPLPCCAGVAAPPRPRAPLEPPDGRVLHLVGQIGQPAEGSGYARRLGPALEPAGENVWVGLGDVRPWDAVLSMLEGNLDRLAREGKLLNLSLGFRIVGARRFETGIDRRVAETDEYDDEIDALAAVLRRGGVPVLLRIGGEVNGAWNGHHPTFFPRAYRKVVDRLRAAGVEDVAFVWCVEPQGDSRIFETDARGATRWYPGDAYVDWFGIDLFRAETFERRGTVTAELLAEARRRGKPVLVGETTPFGHVVPGPEDDPDGARAAAIWEAWFEPLVTLLDRHPEIKAVALMPIDWRRLKRFSNWGDARVHRSPPLLDRWRTELERPRWVHRGEWARVVARER